MIQKTLSKTILTFLGIKAKLVAPVQWRFTVKGGVNNIYRVHITGFITVNWRITAEDTPLIGPIPTIIEFEEAEGIHINGALKVMGHKKNTYNKVNGEVMGYYNNIVNYVQEVHALGTPVTLKGKIKYMPYTDKRCLELMEHPFEIELGLVDKVTKK
jgi:hypothetical protein